jgi:hypothetical protein
MTKNLALATSVMMLVAISGQAFAQTAAPNARYWPEATGPSDRQAAYALCFRFDDGDADGRAQCVPLSRRTEIQRLTFDVLDLSGAVVVSRGDFGALTSPRPDTPRYRAPSAVLP